MVALCRGVNDTDILKCFERVLKLAGKKADCPWPSALFLTVFFACDDHKAGELLKKRQAFSFKEFFNAPEGEPMLTELTALAKKHHISLPDMEKGGEAETKRRIKAAVEATRQITI